MTWYSFGRKKKFGTVKDKTVNFPFFCFLPVYQNLRALTFASRFTDLYVPVTGIRTAIFVTSPWHSAKTRALSTTTTASVVSI